ncbi:MAG: enoyl-CoA hydratase/isomerase family protein [Bacteroidetes bacterium]|nr:MAG: enoyl-CoA hydratase/isomerase family protein [Bacteroidota bacterium]
MNKFELLDYHQENRLASICLNRPKRRNALNGQLLNELKAAISRAESAADVNVVLLKSKGEAFCADPDPTYLRQLQAASLDEKLAEASNLAQVYLKIYRSGKIFLAQVEGDAIGNGLGLLCVCDFVFAVPEAKFGFPEVKMGFVPATAIPFIQRRLAELPARALLLSGNTISTQEAHRLHLVHEVIPSSDISQQVGTFAHELCTQNAPAAMQLVKKMLADLQELPLEHAVKFAAKMNAYSRQTEDFQRGVKALLDEEEIQW